MFSGCKKLLYLDISNFNTRLVNNMGYMFSDCYRITTLDLSNFDTSKVEYMQAMFSQCNAIITLDLTNFNTSSVIDIHGMFNACVKLLSLNLNHFDTKNVIDMQYMFADCKAITSLEVNNFNTSLVKNMGHMFKRCGKLKFLNISNFDTSNVINMRYMFTTCSSLESLNLSNFYPLLVDNMRYIFQGCSKLKSLYLEHFYTSKVYNMEYMFSGCSSLESLNLSNFITSSVLVMHYMFQGCSKLKSLDLSNFDTSKVTTMEHMFEGCTSLISLDLNNFNTRLVTNMRNMFKECTNLLSLNINQFNTIKLQKMEYMFSGCNSLKSLNINNFDTSHVIYMNYSFNECNSLISLDLSNFQTSSNPNKIYMFNGCRSLKILNIKNFIITSSNEFNEMLNDCNNSLIYCLENIPENMNTPFKNNNCSDICFKNGSKLNFAKGTCTENYFNDDLICKKYYNYNHTECLEYIPDGYYLNNITKTVYKCIIKCNKCSFESEQKELCIVCNNNNGYYPKWNDTLNIDNFINCYNETPDGYYLDNEENIFKPIFENIGSTEIKGIYSEITEDIYNNLSEILIENKIIYNLNTNFFTENSTIFSIIINKIEEMVVFLNNNTEKNITIYYYELGTEIDINESLEEYKNEIYIEVTPKIKNFLIQKYNLNEEKDKIFLIISEDDKINKGTSNYTYNFYLENGTELNLDEIKEEVYVKAYVPIKDLELCNYNYYEEFKEQGYDIYDKYSNFYNDVCTPVLINDCDIILRDRKTDIYPNEAVICQDNCEYEKVKEKRFICNCNLNPNKKSNNTDENYFMKVNISNIFVTYLLDNINYEIFICFKLIKSLDNLKNNIAFYTIISTSILIIIFNLVYYFYTIQKIKLFLFKNFHKENNKNIFTKKKLMQKQITSKKLSEPIKRKHKEKKNSIDINNYYKSSMALQKIQTQSSNNDRDNKDDDKEEDINQLPYESAKKKDKRNIFQIFKSIFLSKIELINVFYIQYQLRLIFISQYLTLLMLNIFFNTLLYSNEVISNKYHNNGELDYFTSLLLSLVSNIFTSIISFYLNYSKEIEERLERMEEIKKEYIYIKYLVKVIKLIKIKFIFFFISELIILFGSLYYITIFFIVYTSCRLNLFVNYIISMLEDLIKSLSISIVIVVFRKFGLFCLKKSIYNISKYLDNTF